MPKTFRIFASDSSLYEGCSSYTDIIEKTSPAMHFYVHSIYLLTNMFRCPENIAQRITILKLKKYLSTSCPEFLIELYRKKKKNEQENLLNGKSITPDNLICWFLSAEYLNGKYSQYAYDDGFGDLAAKAPMMIDANDHDNIIIAGKTTLSKASLIHIVEHQKKVFAQFIDFDDGRWYCFYRTHRGLAGRESTLHGPHLHFISNAYGIDRNILVKLFLKGECPHNGYHISLSGYSPSSLNVIITNKI